MPLFSPPVKQRLKLLLAGIAAATTLTFMPLTASAFDEAEKTEIREIIRDYLLENPEIMIEVQEALEAKQDELAKAQQEAILTASADEIFNNPADPVFGNPDGDVTIVEFFDYNCGFCRRGLADMEYILENDKNVRFVLKEFPIFGQNSNQVHTVAMAYFRVAPEKYLEYHTAMMNEQGQINEARALAIAESMGADMDAIRVEMENQAIINSFIQTSNLATGLGIGGTPAYIVGDEVVAGALGKDILLEKVENMRRCGSADCG